MRSGRTSSRTVSALSQRIPRKRETPSIPSRATAESYRQSGMVLLVVFAVLAGAGTAITPCVLPVLPALLSASATGGRRRPLGIVLGLITTHTIAIVALATVIDGVGLPDYAVRRLAIAVLAIFGIALILPAVGDRIERPLSRLARFGPKSNGEGFWSGLAVGGALGFVYAPCAGPILAAVV